MKKAYDYLASKHVKNPSASRKTNIEVAKTKDQQPLKKSNEK